MTGAAKKLLQEVLALPEEDRRWIAGVLRERDEPGDRAAIDAAWRDEALRRADELERGEVEALDGERAIAEIRGEIRAPRSR